MNEPGPHLAEMIVTWLLLIVRVGFLAAIIIYGIIEYRRWSKRRDRHQ
jgi:hypothetical protein